MPPADLDPGLLALLTQMLESGVQPFHLGTPEAARGLLTSLCALSGPGPEMARVENTELRGRDGGAFRVRVLTPVGGVKGIIAYYHGGGWVCGSIDDYDTLGRTLALRTGCAVVLIDYRLAPEHRFPVPVEDCWIALNWIWDNRAVLGGATLPVIVAGDSAGGNLAAVMALKARDAGKNLALQALIYPVTDFDPETASYRDPDNQLLLTATDMLWFWDHYLPDVSTRRHPDVSPLHAASLAGVAPAVVITAEYDVLRDEGEAYAERLAAAGVSVALKRFERQAHGFFTMVNILPASADGIGFLADAVIAALR